MNWFFWKKNDSSWRICNHCDQMEYKTTYQKNLNVCQQCQYHDKIKPEQLIQHLLGNKYKTLHTKPTYTDPLDFIDLKPYKERLQHHSKHTHEAISIYEGKLEDHDIIVCCMDFEFIGGSMGMYAGQHIQQACKQAIKEKKPLICILSSGGARIQEGIYALMQMPKTILAFTQLQQHKIPTINVIANPTMGGTWASFGSMADFIICEPGATVGFTGQRVIPHKDTKEFQTSDFQKIHGHVDQIIHRHKLKEELNKLLSLLKAG